jgi:hypothetical protein
MKEQFRPQPENPKQHTPEAGAGPLGIPPPTPEHSPQGGGSTSPERQPLPSALDILERRAQFYESDLYRRIVSEDARLKKNRARHKAFWEKNKQLGDELATLYVDGTDRDRLIIDIYTTLSKNSSSDQVSWTGGPSGMDAERKFIAKVEKMSEQELLEELRKAREALERKTARYKKKVETERRNKSLPHE